MEIYHLIVNTCFHPDWINRFRQFCQAIKDAGIKTDDKVLFIDNEAQKEIIYKSAKDNFLEIKLMKDDTNLITNSEVINQKKKSKGYRKFHTRLLYFFDDIEVVEIMDLNKEKLAGEKYIFNGVNREQFARLFKRLNTPGSRRNVVSHLKNSVYVSCIKELYEEVILYFGYVLRCAALTEPDANRLIGEHNDIKLMANDLLSLPSREEIVYVIMKQVFRRIENKKDTCLLINTLNDRLALGVDDRVIKAAMPYLEARHIFVHADGIADNEYKNKYPKIKLKCGKIYLDSKIIREYIATAETLVFAFEEKMIESGYYCDKEFE